MSKVTDALAALFDPAEVKFKPQTAKGERALAVAYVDARVVMERLDAAVGAANWQDSYMVLPGDQVECRLSIRESALESNAATDGWVTKTDAGGESEQPDDGDKRKAAYSDAFKRAAVKWGVGRYLYRLPKQWADYDPQKKAWKSPPRLPDWAIPKGTKAAAKKAAPAKEAEADNGTPRADPPALSQKASYLVHLAGRKGADLTKTLSHFKVDAVSKLTDEQLDKVIVELEKKPDAEGNK